MTTLNLEMRSTNTLHNHHVSRKLDPKYPDDFFPGDELTVKEGFLKLFHL